MVAGAIGHWANESRYGGKVAYIIEDGDDGDEMAAALKGVYKNDKQRTHTRMAAPPLVVPKGAARGLEAADLMAWHWNKFYAESVLRTKREARKDFAAFVDFTRAQRKIDVFLYEGDKLERFLIENGCSRRVPS